MAGYNPNSSIGNDHGSILHALFPKRQEQQSPIGSQGAGPSFQANPGYNQSLLQEFQTSNDPRSNSSSRGASPASRQQPMFRSHSGTPPGQVASTNNNPNVAHKTNLLYLLNQRPQPDPATSYKPSATGNDRVQVDQRSSTAGDGDHSRNGSASRFYPQQHAVNHATADSLLALLSQPKPTAPPSQETVTVAQDDAAAAKSKNVTARPVASTKGSISLEALLGIKPQEQSKEDDKTVEKPVGNSAAVVADDVAKQLVEKSGKVAVDQGATEKASAAAERAEEKKTVNDADTGDAEAVEAKKEVVVDTPEIASVIDGVDNLSVGTSKPLSTKGPEIAVTGDKAPASVSASASATDAIADDWETALDTTGEGQDNTKTLVDVFDFHPLQPFISITINPEFDMPRASFSTDDDATMAIAKLKKAFDQNDRTLVTATKNFIIFAMSKNGGVRVVNQDNGENKMVFEETQDQIFNVAACVDKENASETVVATGCSGTVYWFMAKDARGENLQEYTPHHSFAMPPIQSPGDENPGGVLKTRARKSSNHTQFFGVGRGKSIHIIFPNTITKGDFYKPGTARTVDVEKYLAHRTLKIDTGKAAKDFTFSQDDTTVVSLDKAGRIKFWDIRGLVSDDAQSQSVELTEPLLTLVTTPANEKSWPTSIIFIDKLRRVVKNTALRYLLVGMKQNHTLQLWDLALCRIVQEIHLPHDKDSDAACSVVYHVATSMIVVGHPTRNSVYFIHVSLPRFSTHKSLSQADFVEQVGKGTFTAPTTSAAFSTIREYTFSDGVKPQTGSDKRLRGDLRSLDILQEPANTHDDSILFELYTMHSTGVTSIAIRPETLGLKPDLTDIKTLSASKAGLTTFAALKPIEQTIATTPTSPSVATSTSVQGTPQVKEILRKPAPVASTPVEAATMQSPTPVKRVDSAPKVVNAGGDAISGTAEKSEKKKKRKGSSSRVADASLDAVSLTASSKPMQSIPESSTVPVKTTSNAEIESIVKTILNGFDASFAKVMGEFHQHRTTAYEQQINLLEIVSKTLTENVEKSLDRIVDEKMKVVIAPIMNNRIDQVLKESVPYHLTNTMNSTIQPAMVKEVQTAVSGALTKALISPQFMKQMSQSIAQLALARDTTLQGTNETLRSVVSRLTDADKQRKADIDKLDILLKQREADAKKIDNMVMQREADGQKIEKLEAVVHQLGELISSMASAEEKFRQSSLEREDKLLAIIEQVQSSQRVSTPSRDSAQLSSEGPSPTAAATSVKNDAQTGQAFDKEKCTRLMEEITQAMIDSRHSLHQLKNPQQARQQIAHALTTWFSCGNDQMTQVIYDFCLCKEDPSFLYQLDDPIFTFLTMKALAFNLDTTSFKQRLHWLSTAMQAATNFEYVGMDATLLQTFPNIIVQVQQSLEDFYRSNTHLQEPLLRVLADVNHQSEQLLEYMTSGKRREGAQFR